MARPPKAPPRKPKAAVAPEIGAPAAKAVEPGPRKPGRPRIKGYQPGFYSVQGIVHSEHAGQNHHYGYLAINALGIKFYPSKNSSKGKWRSKVPDRYSYFLPHAADTNSPLWRAKWDVLAQLGRVDIREYGVQNHKHAIRFFADEICKLNPPAKEATWLLRKWRSSFLWRIETAPFEGRRVDLPLFAYEARHDTGAHQRPRAWRRALRELRSVIKAG